MATVSQQGSKTRTGGNVSARAHSRTWGKGASGFDGSFSRTKFGYPSASARLGMQAQTSRKARNRVVGSKLTHNATLGYISRGTARRHGLDNPGWTRYLPAIVAAVILVAALAGLGYAGHGESLGKLMGAFKAPSLASATTQVTQGAESQTGVASSRAVVAAASAYADSQDDTDSNASDSSSDSGASTADDGSDTNDAYGASASTDGSGQ